MTTPTNTYTRYTAATNVREDLIEKITMTNPEKTPLTSAFGTAVATNTLHEWQRDSLRSPNKDNAAIDGDDATASAKTPPIRVGNYCQIFTDTVSTSGRADKVKKAGMKTASGYYIAKAYKELQRDQEAMALSLNPAVAGNGALASKSGGLGVLIYTNAFHGGAGATAAHTSGAPTTANTAGTNRVFTEALLKTAVQQTYTNCGEVPPIAMMSPYHKGIFSTFVGIALNRKDIKGDKQATVVGGADVYVSDFGNITVVPNYIMSGQDVVYGINPEYGDTAYLRSYQRTPLGKTGDSDREQVLCDATVRLTSEIAQYAIKNLTPA